MKKVLVVDIGGTNVKAMISREGRRKFALARALLHASFMTCWMVNSTIGNTMSFRLVFPRQSEWPHPHRSKKSRQRLDAIQF